MRWKRQYANINWHKINKNIKGYFMCPLERKYYIPVCQLWMHKHIDVNPIDIRKWKSHSKIEHFIRRWTNQYTTPTHFRVVQRSLYGNQMDLWTNSNLAAILVVVVFVGWVHVCVSNQTNRRFGSISSFVRCRPDSGTHIQIHTDIA